MASLEMEKGEETVDDYTPIPVGWYTSIITETDVKKTKSGTGIYMSLTHEIMDGEYKGRLIFDMITIENQNEDAQQIGTKQRNSLFAACGKAKIHDTDEFLNIPIKIKVRIGTANEGYDPKNEISDYKNVTDVKKEVKPQASKSSPPWA